MSASLQQLLAEQPPTTSGIHEAVARHTEEVFEEFKGILPMFLGKRQLGPFVNVTLPDRVTNSSENLLQTVSDFIWVYELRVISFVSAVRMQNEDEEQPSLHALLITADKSLAYFQLPWSLKFGGNDELISAARSSRATDIVPREIFSQIFALKTTEESKQFSYDRLVERFGGPDELPKP